MVKTWTCSVCGERDGNEEWMSECGYCGACSECGAILPTADDPRETYRLRQPHRKIHDPFAEPEAAPPPRPSLFAIPERTHPMTTTLAPRDLTPGAQIVRDRLTADLHVESYTDTIASAVSLGNGRYKITWESGDSEVVHARHQFTPAEEAAHG